MIMPTDEVRLRPEENGKDAWGSCRPGLLSEFVQQNTGILPEYSQHSLKYFTRKKKREVPGAEVLIFILFSFPFFSTLTT